MDVAADARTVVREVAIDASPETLWELLVDPREMVRWMGLVATVDLRHGGTYSVEVIPGQAATGVFVEIDRPRRLVTTWGWEGHAVVPPGVDDPDLRARATRPRHAPAADPRWSADCRVRGLAHPRLGALPPTPDDGRDGRRSGPRSMDRRTENLRRRA
jgi:uncharacterized protein YndB with AHSA1/START domain